MAGLDKKIKTNFAYNVFLFMICYFVILPNRIYKDIGKKMSYMIFSLILMLLFFASFFK